MTLLQFMAGLPHSRHPGVAGTSRLTVYFAFFVKIGDCMIPHFCSRNFNDVESTPNP